MRGLFDTEIPSSISWVDQIDVIQLGEGYDEFVWILENFGLFTSNLKFLKFTKSSPVLKTPLVDTI